MGGAMFIEIPCRCENDDLYIVLHEQKIISYNTYQGADKTVGTVGYSLKGSDALVEKVGNNFVARIGSKELKLIPV